jgi:transcription termination factor Rho
MSDPVLERSVLERKERDELMTIARALGVKPPARAKKADVVDLILTSTGITSAPAAEAQAPDPEPEPEPAPEVDAELAPAAAVPGRGQRSERTERPDRSARPRPAARTDDASVDEPVDGPDANATANVSASSNGNANGNGNDRERDDQDQDEFGNRRRRRRGRDRERGGNEFRDRPDDAWTGEPVACAGLLDLRDEGYGFLRTKGFLPSKDDVYVSVKQVRQFGLRKGDHVSGASRPANRNEKNPALLRIDEVNAKHPDTARLRPRFEDLTPLFPDERLRLETPGRDTGDMTGRIVDLVAPIGKGQRGLIVSPPKAGKTTVVKQIVQAIERNNPEVHLIVLLVDERPEEVTDMRRSTNGEVVAATFDRPPEEHIALAELTIERAKRLVEDGLDVVIVLDGITRLARAYNLGAPTTGRVMSGGIDTGALYPPKKFFGAARNVEEGGSLTILATALVDTGSKMDEVIFEEFKGTGNMELRLDRRLAERRIYPAIDVDGSSTRHEELLFDRKQLQQAWKIRRALHALSGDAGSPAAALERLLDGMKQYKTNDEFLEASSKA